MKNLFILITILLVFSIYTAEAAVNDSIKNKKTQKPVSFNLTAGTSFMTGFNGFSAMNTYIAPQFKYPLSKRFTLDAGFAIVNTNFNSNFTGENNNTRKPFTNNYTSTFIYAGGKYLLSERFTLSGQAYTEVYTFDNKNNQSKVLNNNIKGAMLGVDYKITENSSIGIHVNYLNGGSSSFYNPSGMPMQSPFYGR